MTEYLHKGGVLRGKGLFMPVEYNPPFEEPDPEYPLVLSTGRTLYHYNAATQTRRSEGLTGKQPEAFVEIHRWNARQLGIEDGQLVDVVSRRGRVRCRAMVSRQVRKNAIWMPFHFPAARTNRPIPSPRVSSPVPTPLPSSREARSEFCVDGVDAQFGRKRPHKVPASCSRLHSTSLES
jgi:predicted molibdopterin-dependent oxidoreductase YjgC